MRIQVRKCRFTGAIFEEKDVKKYITHLKRVRESMKGERENDYIKKTFKEWLAAEKETLVHIDMIIPWFIKNQEYLMRAYNTIYARAGWDDKFYPTTDKFINVKLVTSYDPLTSNGFSCPHNGVTNWCARTVGAPVGYPGFSGSVSGELKRSKNHMASYPTTNLFNMIGINTGSGGGGNESWEYGVEIFLADWPGISQSIMVAKLCGQI